MRKVLLIMAFSFLGGLVLVAGVFLFYLWGPLSRQEPINPAVSPTALSQATLTNTLTSFDATPNSAGLTITTLHFRTITLALTIPEIFKITGVPTAGGVYIGENGNSLILPFIHIADSDRSFYDTLA